MTLYFCSAWKAAISHFATNDLEVELVIKWRLIRNVLLTRHLIDGHWNTPTIERNDRCTYITRTRAHPEKVTIYYICNKFSQQELATVYEKVWALEPLKSSGSSCNPSTP